MRKAMKVVPWPNGLGWDVGKNAEVWKLKNGLGVRISTRDCRIKYLFIADSAVDPVEAVERCKREGKIEE
jgi:hypothetical protein